MTKRRQIFGAGSEALVAIGAYLAYSAARVFVEGGESSAINHAFHLVSIEQTFGLFHEESVQRFVEAHPWLLALMEWTYLWAYLPILVVAGVIIYFKDAPLYRSYRTTMFVSAAIGLLIFAVVPVAPPRMLPEYGFLDPLHTTLTSTSGAKNDFAAVPSFHFAFTMLAAIGVAHAYRWRRWLCVVLAALPAVMLLSIVSTANHFFLDAAAGAVVVMGMWWVFVWRGYEGRRRGDVDPSDEAPSRLVAMMPR
ncbi:MAG TPA: phosphatase PAP2 family protein [Dehalococcoidia bacterium]